MKLKFENVLYKIYSLNETEVNKFIQKKREEGYSQYYAPSIKYEIIYNNNINIIDSYKSKFNDYDCNRTYYYFTFNNIYYVCYLDYHVNNPNRNKLTLPNIGVLNIEIGYDKLENKLCSLNSNIKSFDLESESYAYYNSIKLAIIKNDEKINENKNNCSLFFSLVSLKLPEYGKLKALYNNKHEVELYFKDVLVFIGNSYNGYFGADVCWLHKGAWIQDTFTFVDDYIKKQKELKQINQIKIKEQTNKILSEY